MSKEVAQYSNPQVLEIRKALYKNAVGKVTLRDRLASELALQPEMTILDAGCGNGAVLLDLLKRTPGSTGVGFDSSEGMIAEANASATNTNASARFFVADIDTAQLDQTFDRLLIVHVLHLVPDARATFNRLLTHVKPGGRVVIVLHSSTDMPKLKSWNRWFTETFGIAYKAGRDKFTVEENNGFLSDVSSPIDTSFFTVTIRLTDPKAFVDYVDTTRSRWEPAPTDEQWSAFLEHVRSEVTTEIAANGHFDEIQTAGVITINLPK